MAEGEELTLSNLLRLGVTYTKEARIGYATLGEYGRSAFANRVAENRANDPIRALAAPRIAGGMLEMRAFLEKKGFSLSTPEGRRKTKAYLLDCLARQRDDAAHTREEAKVDHSQAFKDRGLSTDSDLYPDYLIERHLREMAQKGLLKPGGVHRLAIVGPGLLLSAANHPAVRRHRFAGPTAPRRSRCHRSLYLRHLSTSQPAH